MSDERTSSGGLTDNVAGSLAYVTFIPAIFFLAMEPYNRRSFIRFHAFQCLFLTGVAIVLNVGLSVTFGLLHIFALALLPLYSLIGLALFVVWLICVFKAYQGERFKLPIIGDLAEQQAGS